MVSIASFPTATAELQHLLTIPPPTLINNNNNNFTAICIAHAALEHLRDIGDTSYLFLRSILELSLSFTKQTEELLFHCITGCRQVFLLKWNSTDYCSYRFKLCIRDYLMLIGHTLASSRTCRLACYSTSVAFWKRSWNDDDVTSNSVVGNVTTVQRTQQQQMMEDELIQRMHQQISNISSSLPLFTAKNELFHYIETSLLEQHPIQASLYLDSMIGEFVGKSSINYRLPLEFHKQAHRTFEKENLLQCLKISVKGLEHIFVQTNAATNTNINDLDLISMSSIVKLTTNILSWEFGMTAWSTSSATSVVLVSRSVLVRPPVQWRESHIVQPDFCHAIFTIHTNFFNATMNNTNESLRSLIHDVRQLLIHLACINGAIFESIDHRKLYMSAVCDGTITIMQQSLTALDVQKQRNNHDSSEPTIVLDCLQLLSRVIANFKLSLLVENPALNTILQGINSIGNQLLRDHILDCERENGDYESIELYEFRENCLNLLLECLVLLCDDPWLSYSGTESSRQQARMSLASVLGPLYEGFVTCRTKMTAIHECYLVQNHQDDFDEVEEGIEQVDFDEEMSSIAAIGRLHISAAITCLSGMFSTIIPQLNALWDSGGNNSPVTPEGAGLLEVARILALNVCYLLTDKNDGESPSVPDAILIACQQPDNVQLVGEISSAIQALFMLADSHTQRIASNPTNPRLSPLLATAFLTCLHRWVPAYIFPIEYNASSSSAITNSSSNNPLVREWSDHNKVSSVLGFCTSLCLQYQCYWPLEKSVQDNVASVLLAIAKRSTGPIRSIIVQAPAFIQMVRFHCITAGIRHSISQGEFEALIQPKIVGSNDLIQNVQLIAGYHRLPYRDKANIVTAVMVTCSDIADAAATAMLHDVLGSLHETFTGFVTTLSSKQVGNIKFDDVHAQEMACLCVELFCGVVGASEMSSPERIPKFITPYLQQLSGLMKHYATDLTVCEALLRFFRDYTAYFITSLNRDESLALFHATAEVLQSYSTHHCEHRVIPSRSKVEVSTEEEQAYGDVLCAVQLLINLGTKDFIDCCDIPGTDGNGKLQSSQVTDMIFFGLQQIIPLMTQGLLQYPTLCRQFFELVGFMMDTYPEKVGTLPPQLLQSLSDSLLFGMSHTNPEIGKCSLQGLASVAREHLTSGVLASYLTQCPDLFDTWNRRLLTEVIFQNVVLDRTEAAGMALLPMVAVEMNRFVSVIHEINSQIPDARQRDRLNVALSKLLVPETISKASTGGYEGRANRVKFKVNFDDFVNDVHSFLIIR